MKLPSVNSIKNKTIIFVHGFLGEGCENHRMFIRMAKELNKIGFICVLYDQKGCGYSDGEYDDVRLQDVKEDLYTVTTWAREKFKGEIGFLGQSLGSAIIFSMKDILIPNYIIAINPAAKFKDWLSLRYNWNLLSNDSFFCALPKGIFVSRDFINDLMEWEWLNELNNDSIPKMIVASTMDEINSLDTAYMLKKTMKNTVDLFCIEGANHSFIGQRDLEKKATEEIVKWLNNRGE